MLSFSKKFQAIELNGNVHTAGVETVQYVSYFFLN